MKEKLSV